MDQTEFTHNGWLIEERQDGKFDCTHPDFEGPYDDRFIVASSPEEAVRLIDEWVEPEIGYGQPDEYWRESHHAIEKGMGQ